MTQLIMQNYPARRRGQGFLGKAGRHGKPVILEHAAAGVKQAFADLNAVGVN